MVTKLLFMTLLLLVIGGVWLGWITFPQQVPTPVVPIVQQLKATGAITTPTPSISFTPVSSLEQVFESASPILVPEDQTITIVATGDVIPARTVNTQSVIKNDFTWAYHHIAEITKAADLTFINLETPLLANCPDTGRIYLLW